MREDPPLLRALAGRGWRGRLFLVAALAVIALFVRFLIAPAIAGRAQREADEAREPMPVLLAAPMPGADAGPRDHAVLAIPEGGDVDVDGVRMDEVSALRHLRALAARHPGARVIVRGPASARAERLERVVRALGLAVERGP